MGLCNSKVADESSKFFLTPEEMAEREKRQKVTREQLEEVSGGLCQRNRKRET